MVNLKRWKEISKDFESNGIDTTNVGFYDSDDFMNVEANNPEYLNNYAKYVELQNYSTEYIKHVKETLPIICDVLFEELKKDGRLGACIDLSMTLSRILEKEGIWNYMVFGSVTIEYPKSSGLPKSSFWSVDYNPEATAAHAWVVVPPYYIVDLTISRQYFINDVLEHLPRYILETNVKSYQPKPDDIINPRIILELKYQGVRNPLDHILPNFKSYNNIFSASSVTFKETKIRYIPTAISAPDASFEKARNLKLNGEYGYQIYMKKVKPALLKKKDE